MDSLWALLMRHDNIQRIINKQTLHNFAYSAHYDLDYF
jgi:hypothetical protein